ncbi:hypothetical protein KC726_04490 [Candidatus Woesebacteria bacterium]|nr:hypothetical protein [Candidatus Woesebacteria bacterium]
MKIKAHGDHFENHKQYLSVIRTIEAYLDSNGYQRLMLPVLSPALIPESYLEIFETTFTYLKKSEHLYLTPSPELFIKRLIAEGVGDCYYLGPSFRNAEPNSPKHMPEFTMLELYGIGKDYMFIADEVLSMLQRIAKKLYSSSHITYAGTKVDFSRWEKMTVAQAFERYAGITPEQLFNTNLFCETAKAKRYVTDAFSYEDLWSQMYAQEVEPHLGMNGHATLLYDYPVQFATLSKPNDDGVTAQRFEFYIAGVEIGNCYSELTDWKLQEQRLKEEQQLRKKHGLITHPSDDGFIDALKKGMPACSGIAIGVERLAMVMLDLPSIEDLQVISVV